MYEDCDDQNVEDGDGCSSECYLEKGWTCDGAPSQCNLISESETQIKLLYFTAIFIVTILICTLYKVIVWYSKFQKQ